MELIVIRHGPAGRATADLVADDARKLTKKGRKETRAAMRGVALLAGKMEKVISSPLPRAAETADLLAEVSALKNVKIDERLLNGGDVDGLVDELKDEVGSIAIVGHDPQLSRLVAQLSTGRKVARPQFISLDKAGAASLSLDGSTWSLNWVAGRDQLARLKTKT
jgi:phosphohistidine phosphatase